MNLIFIDIDGTLLWDLKNIIPESAKAAIKKAQQQGDLVFVNTGRCRAQIYDDVQALNFDGYVCSDGCYIEYKGKVLKNETLEPAAVKDILDFLQENNRGAMVEAQNGVWLSSSYNDEMKSIVGEKMFELFDKNFPNQTVRKDIPCENVGKVNYFVAEGQEEFYQKIYEKYSSSMNVTKWYFFDGKTQISSIGVKNADKVNGVKFIQQYLNLQNVKTFAFGDADADIEMIKYCDVGVAMGKSTEKLKSVCDYVTENVENDGIALAFEKFILK